ncbi:MAG: TolC family protein [Bryobacteraceae bacterium]|jgi:cobalt-zinc-cadmium efflux system outer membrane protein
MQRLTRQLWKGSMLAICWIEAASAQKVLTWQQARDEFEQSNPTILAARIGIDESRAEEVTAFLRPNPDLTVVLDQINPFSKNPVDRYAPFAFALPAVSSSYLHERRHKRELRLESAKKATDIAQSQLADQERNLIFNLRTAFINAMQAKAVLELAKDNLTYYDKELGISRDRYAAGDIARVDLDRLELQRVQYESDLQTADVNLRTAKIQLLQLLNDKTPIARFDVSGPFDFSEATVTQDELRRVAQEERPDLKAAVQAVDKAQTDYKLAVANGSTDPTFGVDFGRNPPIPVYMGLSVNIPLRIFDRNQGEKARTKLDITRNQKLVDAAEAQVFSDVDSAFATLNSTVTLLRPYKSKYLETAARVRDTIAFSYQHGQAALVDFLDAQRDYRAVQVTYLNLVGSYLTAAGQLNLAVGREVIQ